jgi:hypothetical protein
MVVTKESSQPYGRATLKITYFAIPESKLIYDTEKLNSDISDMKSKLNGQIGARHIFDAICEAKKTVVGHNCYLDLAHIFQKFHRPLPDHVGKCLLIDFCC